MGSIKDYFESLGGYETLEKQLQHPNFNIYEKVSGIIDKYFKNNDDNVDYFFSSEYHINNQRNDKLYDNTGE